MMHRSIQPAICASMLLLAAYLPARADDPVVASIGSQQVKASEIKDFLDALNPQQREAAAKEPKLMDQVVRSAIARKLVLAEASKQSWDKKPEVAAAIARARDEVVYSTFLRAASLPANYPTEDDVKAAYDANRDRLHQYHLAQIFLAETPGSSKDALDAVATKAQDLAKKARAKGTDFAALAKANSNDTTSAPKGGDLGWIPESQLLPEMLGAVTALPEKGVSEPVHTAGGWHIMMLLGTKPADYAQVHDQFVAVLRETKTAQASQAYVAKLLDDNHVTVNETAAAGLFGASK
ncbi:MAG TPA: peptidylprolyl isomerase [Stellaceae bacterium]|nr:peptidylprolyl isomerase [Stellaceae bacterium]